MIRCHLQIDALLSYEISEADFKEEGRNVVLPPNSMKPYINRNFEKSRKLVQCRNYNASGPFAHRNDGC